MQFRHLAWDTRLAMTRLGSRVQWATVVSKRCAKGGNIGRKNSVHNGLRKDWIGGVGSGVKGGCQNDREGEGARAGNSGLSVRLSSLPHPSFNGFVQHRCWTEKNPSSFFLRHNHCCHTVLWRKSRAFSRQSVQQRCWTNSDSHSPTPFPTKLYVATPDNRQLRTDNRQLCPSI
jgi:hypothetical protein